MAGRKSEGWKPPACGPGMRHKFQHYDSEPPIIPWLSNEQLMDQIAHDLVPGHELSVEENSFGEVNGLSSVFRHE